jgi:hypothetical protein
MILDVDGRGWGNRSIGNGRFKVRGKEGDVEYWVYFEGFGKLKAIRVRGNLICDGEGTESFVVEFPGGTRGG